MNFRQFVGQPHPLCRLDNDKMPRRELSMVRNADGCRQDTVKLPRIGPWRDHIPRQTRPARAHERDYRRSVVGFVNGTLFFHRVFLVWPASRPLRDENHGIGLIEGKKHLGVTYRELGFHVDRRAAALDNILVTRSEITPIDDPPTQHIPVRS